MFATAPGGLSTAGGNDQGPSFYAFLPHGQILWIVVVLFVLLVVVGCWRRYGLHKGT